LLEGTDLAKILAKEAHHARLVSCLDEYQCLATLDESTLLDHYYPAVINDNVSPFKGFTQDHRDAYLRIRFRAENRRNSQGSGESTVASVAVPEDVVKGLELKIA